MSKKHGIAIRTKKAKTLVRFISCSKDKTIQVLADVNNWLNKDVYEAKEEYIEEQGAFEI